MAKSVLVPGWPWYVKDGRLHWAMQQARRASVATFEPLGEYWGRDAERVYVAGSEMRDADRETFQVLNTLYAKDRRKAYTLKGPIAEADAATFEAIGPTEHAFNTTNGYAKDSRNVYHTTVGGKACVIKGADADSFVSRGHGYGSDSSAVYFERKRVPGADPAAWRLLRGPHSCSGTNAYVLGQRIGGADGRRLESLPVLEGPECWSRDDNGYYRWTEPGDPRQYFQEFRRCFVFLGKVSGVSLTWDRTNPLPPELEDSWAIAKHAWIDVVCREWLQKPDVHVTEIPKLGEPFRFGQGLRLCLLAPPTWMHEDRIWIFRPIEDPSWADGRLVLSCSEIWWEYLSLSQIDIIQSLIAATKSA